MASSSNVTQDHEQIRKWAEERGAVPTCVKGTGGKDDTGVLRLEFPGSGSEDSLQEISWEDWFDKFDQNNLALLYQEETAEGQKSNFNKIVSAETAAENAERSSGHSRTGGRKKAAAKSSAKKTFSKKAVAKKKSAPATKKASVKKSTGGAKKAAAKKSVKKVPPKKAVTKKAAPKKTATKKAATKKPATKKAASKQAVKSTKKTASKATKKSTGRRR